MGAAASRIRIFLNGGAALHANVQARSGLHTDGDRTGTGGEPCISPPAHAAAEGEDVLELECTTA